VSDQSTQRRLAAIMFTDIVSYTALMAESEERALAARERHRAVVRPLVERHGGQWIEEIGDESLSCFPSALDAVSCALAVQEALRGDLDLQLRIGIHLGDVVFEGERVYGDGVNVASRIRPLAEPGGICVSGEIQKSIRNQPGIEAVGLGERTLKNVGQPVAVFAVGRPGAVVRPSGRALAAPAASRSARYAAAALGVALLAALGIWLATRPGAPSGPIRSIAVLPLENISGDPGQEYFADGMTEALIGDIAKLEALRVISRTSVMHYKGARKPLPEIADELDVDAIVEGTVLREGERVRITAQLIDARTDHHLWSDRYDRELRDVLALQSDVARAIAAEIQHELTPREEARLSDVRRVDPAAHDAYLRGRYQFSRYTKESVRSAVRSYEAALALDPSYAPAHAGIALSYFSLGFPLTAMSPREAMPKAKAAALRALELDESLGEAHGALGLVERYFDWDMAAAERSFERAYELSPSDPRSWVGLVFQRGAQGHTEEALELCRRAVAIAPLDPWQRHILAECFYFAGRYEEARDELERLIELDEGFVRAYQDLCWVYATLGREADLLRTRAGYMRLNGYSSDDLKEMYRAYESEGMAGYWRYWLADPSGVARSEFVIPFHQARAHTALGEIDEAFEWLERTYDERGGDLAMLRVWPWTAALRQDPRFEYLARRVGLPGQTPTSPSSPQTRQAGGKPAVAVLAFADLSSERDQGYFADGLAEEIIHQLARLEDLRVSARTSAFAFKGRDADVRAIGERLGVSAVLEGSVRKAGDRLRITAQLVDVRDGFHLWSETFDRPLGDIFAIQSEIARAVSGALLAELASDAGARTPPTSNLAAYDDYLRGREHLYAYTQGGRRKAIEYFESALARDPDFARAHAGLADAYSIYYGFGLFGPEESRARATAAARRALELDPEMAEAYTSMGWVQAVHDWDFEVAGRSWRRAIELAPGLMEPRLWNVVLYVALAQGRIEEALGQMPDVLALDPLSPMVQTNAAALLYFARRYDEAASSLGRILEEQPDYQYARLMLARTHIQRGHHAEAARALEDWLARRGEPAPYGGAFLVPPEGLLGYVRAISGRRTEALVLLSDLESRERPGSVWPVGAAVIQMGLGETDRAFASLDRAVEGHRIDHWLKVDPLYDPLRSDARFAGLVKRAGLEP